MMNNVKDEVCPCPSNLFSSISEGISVIANSQPVD